MKKNVFRKVLSLSMAFALSISITGCSTSSKSSNSTASGSTSKEGASSSAPVAKTKVAFWYLWGGASGKNVAAAIDTYNKKSSKYEVDGLSVPDSQKVTTAISAGNGPDVTDEFSNDVGKLATAGVMEPLDDYITKTNYNIGDFIPAAVNSCKMKGKLYALPVNITVFALYYNKTLLKNAGFNEPPKTLEEMYDMAVKTTKVNSDGTINICGFPDFPSIYYLNNFATAAGGGWYDKDGKPSTADSYGNKYALKLTTDFRKKFGLANVIKFESGAKDLDPTDPFFTGKQTFRVEGPWMGKSLKETFKSNVDYGVTYLPYPKDKPELQGSELLTSSMLFIPANAKNKDGAWDFMSWAASKEGQIQATIPNGDFPSSISAQSDEAFLKGYDVNFYSKLTQGKNVTCVPNGPKNAEYDTIVGEQTELCMNLKQDIDTTLKNVYQKGSDLMK